MSNSEFYLIDMIQIKDIFRGTNGVLYASPVPFNEMIS